jgi:hypothetical protein
MVTRQFLSCLVDKLKKTQFRGVALKLLYHLSRDPTVRPLLVDTEAMSLVLRLIHGFPHNTLSAELIGLAINMFHCQEAVNAFCTPEAMKMLVVRTLKTRDSLLMKVRTLVVLQYAIDCSVRGIAGGSCCTTCPSGRASKPRMKRQIIPTRKRAFGRRL